VTQDEARAAVYPITVLACGRSPTLARKPGVAPMSHPLSLTASAIAPVALQKFLESGAGKLGEKYPDVAISLSFDSAQPAITAP
jgi:hypothetical protein